MTLLLLGCEGQVGRAVSALAVARGLPLTALSRRDLDITDRAALGRALGAGYTAVINCAAYTAVDRAEREEARAMAVNRDGARSEEHTSELQSLMRISYAVFCLKKKNRN